VSGNRTRVRYPDKRLCDLAQLHPARGVLLVARMLPTDDLPRERLLRGGALDLADSELLSIVLGHARTAVGQALLARFPDLRRMASAGIAELAAVEGVGPASASRVKAALALAGRLGQRPYARGDPLGRAADVDARVGRRLALLDREVFVALALDGRNRVLAELRLAQGGACSVEVLPRDLFAQLVREAAVAVIFVHNHPSGDPTPSPADRVLTERLRAAGRLVGVRVLDHVVVGSDGFTSLAESWEKEVVSP
jgi:DNA repair protein RadC